MKTIQFLTLAGTVLATAYSASQASPLNLVPQDGAPVADAWWLSLNYTPNGSDNFQAASTLNLTMTYPNEMGYTFTSDSASFNLNATITTEGRLTAGTLTLSGDLGMASGGDPTGVVDLLTGNLLTSDQGGFGFAEPAVGNEPFEFKFSITGGAFATDLGGIAATGGIILYPWFDFSDSNPFLGDWGALFNNDGSVNAEAQVFAVPEPSSLLLVSVGSAFCAMALRRRRG